MTTMRAADGGLDPARRPEIRSHINAIRILLDSLDGALMFTNMDPDWQQHVEQKLGAIEMTTQEIRTFMKAKNGDSK